MPFTPPIVSGCLCFFTVSSVVFFFVNTRECFRRKAPFKSMFTMLSVGSFILVLNQITFQVLADGPADAVWGTCLFWQITEPLTYLLVQLIFTTCLIWRSTSILKVNVDGPWYLSKRGVRAAMFLVFAIAFGLVLASICMAAIGVNKVTNRCIYVPLASINNPGKIMYFVLYSIIIGVFLVTMKRHIKMVDKHTTTPQSGGGGTWAADSSSSNTSATGSAVSAPTTSRRKNSAVSTHMQPLQRLVHHMTGRVVLAMLVYLGTAVAGFANGFAGGVYVGFSLQNQAAVLACTLAVSRRSNGNTRGGSRNGSRNGPPTSTGAQQPPVAQAKASALARHASAIPAGTAAME